MTCNPVVPSLPDVTEEDFHAAMLTGLARAQKRVGGPGALADKMELCTKQLKNIRAGAAPHPRRLWNALKACPHALDDIAREYGFRLVPRGAARSSVGEDLQVAIDEVDRWLGQSMHSGSEEGSDLSRNELMRGEQSVRDLHHKLGHLIDLIDQAKEHKLRSVPGHRA